MRRRVSNDTFGRKVTQFSMMVHKECTGTPKPPKGLPVGQKGTPRTVPGSLAPEGVDVGSGGAVLDTVSASEFGEFRKG